jgi:tetratricopeptide (TPR) repeat protein
MWHFAHGMALLGKGDTDGARQDADSLEAIRAATPAEAVAGPHPSVAMLGMYEEILDGQLAAAQGDDAGAVSHLQRSIEIESGLNYDEPPPAYMAPRQLLGVELLRQGKAKEAEAAFRADLKDHRENGWSLHGLALALERQGRKAEAAAVRARFEKAWRGADVRLMAFK